MTVLVGIKKGKKVVLASDSLATYNGLKLVNTANDGKIWDFPNFSVASAGEGPITEILESIKADGEWTSKELNSRMDCAELMESFGEKFNDRIPEASSESLKYEFLIATKEKLFWCLSEPSIFEIDTYWAAGSGGDFALGALHALYSKIGSGLTIEDATKCAVMAACKFNPDCEAPVDIRVM